MNDLATALEQAAVVLACAVVLWGLLFLWSYGLEWSDRRAERRKREIEKAEMTAAAVEAAGVEGARAFEPEQETAPEPDPVRYPMGWCHPEAFAKGWARAHGQHQAGEDICSETSR